MKIGPRPTVARAAASARVAAKSAAGAPQAAAGASQAAQAVPTTSIMGIPTEEVTPRVKIAIEALMQEVERLRKEMEELRRQNAGLEKIADEDAMLPVANRRAFVRELSRNMSFSERYDQPSSLAFFDVNNMKTINDMHGHAAGDAALMHVAQTLVDNVRHSDMVGRLGGDEFGVLLAQIDEAAAKIKTEELADKINANPVKWRDVELEVTIAHGSYTFNGAEDAHEALEAADRAMYAQKKSASG